VILINSSKPQSGIKTSNVTVLSDCKKYKCSKT